MASSLNNVYQTVRQFQAAPQAPARQTGGSLQGANIQADRQMGPSLAQQLAQFAQSAPGAVKAIQEDRTESADKQVREWMRDKTLDEYRDAIHKGNVPFQDDPLAMSVLHNKSAYNLALQVEQDIEAKITQGSYDSVDAADQARIEALRGAREAYTKAFGTAGDTKAFDAGFYRDEEKRRDVLARLQTDVTNKRLKTEAEIIAKADMVAPIPEVIRGGGPQVAAQYIVNSAKKAFDMGQVRTDAERLGLISTAMDSLQESPQGHEVLRSLGEMKVPFGGQDVSLREVFGGGKFDLMVVNAQTKENERNGVRFVETAAKLSDMVSLNDDVGIRKHINGLVEESGGGMTPEIERANHYLTQVKHKQEVQAAAAQKALGEKMASDGRVQNAMTTLSGLIDGSLDGAGVSTNITDMGLDDREERSRAESQLISGYPEGPKRDKAILRLAASIPDGYAANAIKGQVSQANADWQVLMGQINAGKAAADLNIPASITRVQALAQVDATALYGADEKPPFMDAMEIGERLGQGPVEVAVATAKWKALPEKQRNDTMKMVDKSLARLKMAATGQNQEALRTLAGTYMSFNLDPETAVKRAEVDFKDQHVMFNDNKSAVHKSFFAVDGGATSVKAGEATFQGILTDAKKTLAIPDDKMMHIQYDPAGKRVLVRSILTGETVPVTQEELRSKYQAQATESTKKRTAKTKQQVEFITKKYPDDKPTKGVRAGHE
ncbi:internal virion protein [Ralstonia phage RPSC1]|uniref:Putative internal virion protein C n=1 Tax=Ralstonia phage RPSC1 TaxID=2041351 RepID=A0A2Z2U7T3_9CAUD|nr:internal virion protein [Ralstonia phage RPSC1]ATN92936.1 putative internal virion protein C [Ralstonia phage RPSC1]